MPRLARALPAALLAALLVLPVAAPTPAAAATAPDPRVVVIVGPVGDHNAHYKSDADAIATEAKRYTTNVVKVYTPNATWSRVKNAIQGANIVVYLGHGNGWPSKYTPWQPYTKDGFGLDPDTGADGTKHTYYGEYYIARDVRLAPNAVVLFYHLCYASGNTEPGLPTGTFADSKARVDNYGAGFLAAGARAVLADGHPYHPAVDYIRQMFTTRRTIDQVFHADPAYNGHVKGPYESTRTPGLEYELDPDIGGSSPSGFYRSVVGDLGLTTTAVTGATWAPTDEDPADFVVPGAAEVTASAGVGLFASNASADDPAGAAATTLAPSTRLRMTATGTPMADGTRVFTAEDLDGSPAGWVRETGLTPRDSLATKIWTLDRPAALVSPNGDGIDDEMDLGVRFSEPVSARFRVRDASGTTVRSIKATGDVLRFDWDLTVAGVRIPDGAYSWSLTGSDAWGNAGASAAGSFVVDSTDPVTRAVVVGVPGEDGWLRSQATITLSARDATSGVATTTYVLDGRSTATYSAPLVITGQGAHAFTFRSTDEAGNVEATQTRTFAVDSVGPSVAATIAGTAGDAAGWYRSEVVVGLAAADPTSGVARATYSLDGAPAASLPASVAIQPDGAHTLSVTVVDVAGNVTKKTYALTVDTVAPEIAVPATTGGTTGSSSVPSFSPNGDGYRDTYRQSFSLSEAATVTASIRSATGVTVRTLRVSAARGAGSVTWDGRTSTGAIAPDGRYELALSARDKAGNVSLTTDATVDVFGSLTGIHRSRLAFDPQDRDALAATDTLTFTLRHSARVTLRVVDADGNVVRTRYSATPLAAGTYSWTWNGRRADGTWVPQGRYSFDVAATNGTGSERRLRPIYAGAFQLTASSTAATRGKTLTVTALSIEGLAANPRLYVSQPGLSTWSVAMSHVGGRTYRATIRLRTGGSAGTLRLYVKGTDVRGGHNTSTTLRLALA